jgi:hypothetical protein
MRSINSFTINQESKGELACRSLNAKAWEYLTGTDPLKVYEVMDGEQKLYCVRGALEYDNLTFKDLEEMFADLQKESDLQDLKDLDGEILDDEQFEELDQSEYVTACENNGNSGQYNGCTWYTYTLTDSTEINVYCK